MRYEKATVLALAGILIAVTGTGIHLDRESKHQPGQVVNDVASIYPDPMPAKTYMPAPARVPTTVHKKTVEKKPTKKKATTVVVTVKSHWNAPANTYFGPGYDPKYEVTRQCIVMRESNGHYNAHNSSGAGGAYQFMPDWTRTIQHWTKEYVPIWKMSRKAQDKAWWLAWDHGKNAQHWAGGRWHCPYT